MARLRADAAGGGARDEMTTAEQAIGTQTPAAEAAVQGHADTCPNCGAALTGDFCAGCGQPAHLHATLGDLLHEMFEGVAHFDGRLWRTLPLLMFNPGQLSRRWKAGERVKFVHPLHVFLFAIFLVFTLPYVTGEPAAEPTRDAIQSELVERAEARVQTNLPEELGARGASIQASLEAIAAKLDEPHERAYFQAKYTAMAYKLAWLIAPISTLLLALLMALRRGYSLYDHGVVSLYGLGFLGPAVSVGMVLPRVAQDPYEIFLAIAAPLHATAHLRGAYGLSWTAASLAAAALGLLTLAAFVGFLAGVFVLTAST